MARKVETANVSTGRDPKARGQYASVPNSTEQFKRWLPNRKHEYFETMARMYIKVANRNRIKNIRNNIVGTGKNQDSSDGGAQALVDVLVGDGTNKTGFGYLDFLLHTADHAYQEKMQLCEVLSDNYVAFFFGQAPPIFSYTGTVMNTWEDNWLVNLYRVFQYLARGTKLAARGLDLQLTYDSFTFFGAMTSLNWRLVSGQESYVNFSFNFLVKKANIVLTNTNVPYDLRRGDRELAEQQAAEAEAAAAAAEAALQDGHNGVGGTGQAESYAGLDDLLFPSASNPYQGEDPVDPYNVYDLNSMPQNTFLDTSSEMDINALNDLQSDPTNSLESQDIDFALEGEGPLVDTSDPDAFPMYQE
jgi:hypothetical protein